MDSQNLQQLIRLGPDSTIEFKQIVFQDGQTIIEPYPDDLSDELAAFVNSSGGMLVLGVDAKTLTITGIPREQIEIVSNWLHNIANERVNPPLKIRLQNIELPNAEGETVSVVVVNVTRSLWIHESANGYFRRIADFKRWLSAYELEAVMMQRGLSWTYILANGMGVPSRQHMPTHEQTL